MCIRDRVLGVNIKTLLYQVPGGMLSNLISQLKEQGKEDKYEEVLAEDVYKRQVPCRVGLGQLENLLEDVLNNRATLETLHLI